MIWKAENEIYRLAMSVLGFAILNDDFELRLRISKCDFELGLRISIFNNFNEIISR